MTELVLEFSDVTVESMGDLNPGKMKFSDQQIEFKNIKTGKINKTPVDDVESCCWIRLANKPAIKLILKNKDTLRYGGFRDTDQEKIKTFISKNWDKELKAVEQCVKGWNYGRANFEGPMLEFEVADKSCFEIPLSYVSNCTVGKNEAAVEFHQNDESAVSLMEMRFHVPAEGAAGDEDPVEEFKKAVMKYAGVVQLEGRPIATLEQINCATPRGRYDIKIYPSHLSLHGKTYDYKIPIKTILRLFLLPHKDGRRMFFVVSLDPPIRQGQTRYHFLVFEFDKDQEIEDLELDVTEEQLKVTYANRLEKTLSGPVYEIVSKLMRALVNQRIIVPGSFTGHSGTSAVGCAYKSASGTLYPLEKGFMYIHKPPMYIRFEEIAFVNFARSDVSTRSFDFEIEKKGQTTITFNSIEKEEYTRLFDFVNKKGLRVRNASKRMDKVSYKDDFAASSDEEVDPYKERLKKEVKEREEDMDDDDESEEDSDYDPENDLKKQAAAKQAAKEKEGSGTDDSSGSGSEPDEEYDSGADESDKSEEKPKKVKKKKVDSDDKVERSKPSGRKRGAKKDPNAPKKPMSAYFLWLNDNRESIKEPGMAITEVSKKAGQLWRTIGDAEKKKYEEKVIEEKERYKREMEVYNASGGAASFASKVASSKGSTSKSSSKSKPSQPSTTSPSKGVKSKEFIDSSGSSDDDKADDKNVKKKDDKEESGEDSEKKSSGSEEEESGGESDAASD